MKGKKLSLPPLGSIKKNDSRNVKITSFFFLSRHSATLCISEKLASCLYAKHVGHQNHDDEDEGARWVPGHSSAHWVKEWDCSCFISSTVNLLTIMSISYLPNKAANKLYEKQWSQEDKVLLGGGNLWTLHVWGRQNDFEISKWPWSLARVTEWEAGPSVRGGESGWRGKQREGKRMSMMV